MTASLPIAGRAHVRVVVRRLARRHRGALAATVLLNASGAAAGLVGPTMLGRLVDALGTGTTPEFIAGVVAVMFAALVVQALLIAAGTRVAIATGEVVFASLREDFVDDVLGLPISVVEHAGTGDLLNRTTSDIDAVSQTIRYAVPDILISAVTIMLTLVAAAFVSPVLSAALLVGAPIVVILLRWYLRRAPAAYLANRGSFGPIFDAIGESADGSRVVDVLRLGPVRAEALREAIGSSWITRKRLVRLKMVFLPVSSFAFGLPVVAVLLWGGWLTAQDAVSVGAVTAVAVYAMQLVAPVERFTGVLDELQLGTAALARVLGVGEARGDRSPSAAEPHDDRIRIDDVRFAYGDGPDVLRGVSLELAPGERVAVVGPSGAGKSTLARLLAGIDPPTSGSATIGGVPLAERPLEQLRREVALVTQEHHVFAGSVADNVRLGDPEASDARVLAALDAVEAGSWVRDLPDGPATVVGSGAYPVSDAQAQEIALARLILADPHTVVLDEATSLLDGRSARRVERSVRAALAGRTVVAIAHRLHTAYDADRIAVVDDGRITELGSHDELLARGGAYAALWGSWRGDDPDTVSRQG